MIKMKITNKKYNLSNKLNKKIVLISDIHYYSKKDIHNLNKVLDNIKKINPDYICITGDITDVSVVSDFDLLIEWLNKLTNICKVIMNLGNHEYYVNRKKCLFELNSEYIEEYKKIKNLYFLDNSCKVLDNINFIGLTLPIEHYMYNGENIEEFKKYLNKIKIDDKHYNVLLCHSPINISKEDVIKNTNINLALCGHMHGGMVLEILRPLFKNRGLISPQKGLFPKYAYGNIKAKDKNIIITSGIKKLSENHFPIFNFIFSSEVVEINI